jgi:tRNA-specific 2-thiouridylase
VGSDKRKVAVALSGGVDSSLTALILKEQGRQVVGLSLRLGQGADQAWQAGARVAGELGIPHLVVEAAPQFEDLVVRPAIESYARGLTPNPCARCNAMVKFPLLWRAAREAGCELLATGHYARLKPQNGGVALEEGVDRAKSQAYFLARLSVEQLINLFFPLGGLTKSQVRARASEAGLSAAEQSESQDACFLPAGGWDELVSRAGAVRPGLIVDQEGRALSRHQGLHRFTIGKRRGLGVALGAPRYVLAINGDNAEVVVGPAAGLKARGLIAKGAIWHDEFAAQEDLTVRLRYTHPGVACRITAGGPSGGRRGAVHGAAGPGRCQRGDDHKASREGQEEIVVEFAEPQQAVAPGQLAVFNRGARVVGSAWITRSLKDTDGG